MSAEASSTQASLSASQAAGWLELLVARGAVTSADVAQLHTVQRESNQSLASVALRLGKISERALAEAMAEARGFELVSAADFPKEPAAPANVLPAFWRNHELLPLVGKREHDHRRHLGCHAAPGDRSAALFHTPEHR